VNLKEAIEWAERDISSMFGKGDSTLVFYVYPWNDGYCVCSDSKIKRHPHIKWVYNTKDKWKTKQ